MSHGGDGYNELAIAKIQMRVAAETLSDSDGLRRQHAANRSELTERLTGALAALFVIGALLSLITDIAQYAAPACIAIAVLCGVYALHSRRKLTNLRENQLRAVAQQRLQEKNNA